MVILDTNVLIDHIRRPKGVDSHLVKLIEKLPQEELVISAIVIQELYSGLSSRTYKHQIFIAIISSFRVLPYNNRVAQMAGEIIRDSQRSIEFADAAIAATAILNKVPLFTLNKKDFQDIRNLKLFYK